MGAASSSGSGAEAVYAAARAGDAQRIVLLAEQGAGLEWRDAKGRTPLFICIQHGQLTCAWKVCAAHGTLRARGQESSSDDVTGGQESERALARSHARVARRRRRERLTRLSARPARGAAP